MLMAFKEKNLDALIEATLQSSEQEITFSYVIKRKPKNKTFWVPYVPLHLSAQDFENALRTNGITPLATKIYCHKNQTIKSGPASFQTDCDFVLKTNSITFKNTRLSISEWASQEERKNKNTKNPKKDEEEKNTNSEMDHWDSREPSPNHSSTSSPDHDLMDSNSFLDPKEPIPNQDKPQTTTQDQSLKTNLEQTQKQKENQKQNEERQIQDQSYQIIQSTQTIQTAQTNQINHTSQTSQTPQTQKSYADATKSPNIHRTNIKKNVHERSPQSEPPSKILVLGDEDSIQ